MFHERRFVMSEPVEIPLSVPVEVSNSPPAAPQPQRPSVGDDVRAKLHRLAAELIRTRNRRLLAEFLTLRRTIG
jgi:hypothetical protein